MDFNNATTFNENFSSERFRRVHQPYDHQHWDYFFERGDLPAPAWMHYATGSYILLVSLTGSIGNALLLWAFSCAPTLRSPSNLLIANLAVADLGLSLFTFPLITISSYQKQWAFGKIGCDYYVVTAGLFGLGSISTMASISVDRWCSITKWSQWHLTYRRAYIWMMAIWLYSFAMIGPPLMGWSRYVIEGFQTSCTFDWLTHEPSSVAFVWYLIILGFLLPLFVIFLCYTQIISHLVRHRTIMSKAGFSLRPSEGGRKFVRASDSGVAFEPVRPRANSTMGGQCIQILNHELGLET
ncbi:hypothetical protein RvY_17298-2 [Ramazzottius varieornatus]|uniref:G-protein coupled receptors family 1 profile domain-containing protein n=1 Tax=Ramazzottius varieornatus TaxID=947166 RepID=A0A1D1W8S0_RAMVA|nr:hypothetical protein RvY_17298-2 [Ramazzottius varieornatus]